MAYLAQNWFISDLFDVEYKNYQVLDYVQKTNAHFDQKELFPYFDYLVQHLDLLEAFQQAKKNFESGSSSTPNAISFQDLHPGHPVSDLEQILSFAQKQFRKCRIKGEFIMAELYDKMNISKLGLINPNAAGGLVIISDHSASRVYTYEHRLIKRPNTYFQYKDIKTQFATCISSTTPTDAHEIKWEILKSKKFNCGINTYHVEVEETIPHFETLLPLVKNHLLVNAPFSTDQNTPC